MKLFRPLRRREEKSIRSYMMQQEKFGIYLNIKERKVLRISSPYWIPSGDEWVLLTPDTNATLVKIREMAREKAIIDDPDSIVWGDWSKVLQRD
jgi:hypothetical protein